MAGAEGVVVAEYDDTNTVTLWKNDQQGNEKRPVLTGKVNIDGAEYKVSLWRRNSDNPKAPVFGGTVEPAEQPAGVGASDNDIPF